MSPLLILCPSCRSEQPRAASPRRTRPSTLPWSRYWTRIWPYTPAVSADFSPHPQTRAGLPRPCTDTHLRPADGTTLAFLDTAQSSLRPPPLGTGPGAGAGLADGAARWYVRGAGAMCSGALEASVSASVSPAPAPPRPFHRCDSHHQVVAAAAAAATQAARAWLRAFI
jgi:hypothetical protein